MKVKWLEIRHFQDRLLTINQLKFENFFVLMHTMSVKFLRLFFRFLFYKWLHGKSEVVLSELNCYTRLPNVVGESDSKVSSVFIHKKELLPAISKRNLAITNEQTTLISF